MARQTPDDLTVVFAGGGTGGHIMPGVAVARTLCQMLPGTQCLFLCTRRSSEQHCREALAGFEVTEIPAARWRGGLQRLRFAATSLSSTRRSLEILRSVRPHVVVGLGGYSCVVPVMVARALRIPTMVLESNAIPGRVVRMLAPIVDCVQLQWPIAARLLRAKRVLVSGNPVRADVLAGDRAHARRRLGLHPDRCTLLATGGSQGALPVNRALDVALRYLLSEGKRLPTDGLQVLHLTGPDHLAEARRSDWPPGFLYQARAFMTHMQDAYAAADLVLARAGGSTLAEITAVGLPAILIPYPHATDNHQLANASVLAEAGAAIVLCQHKLTPRKLGAAIALLAGDVERRRAMAGRARALGRPGAAVTVAAELASMAGFQILQIRDTNRSTGPSQVSRAA